MVREGERIWDDLGDEFDPNTLYKALNKLKTKLKTTEESKIPDKGFKNSLKYDQ